MEGYKLKIKPAFIERYKTLTDWDTFYQISSTFLRKSIRVNTLKSTVPDVVESLNQCTLTPIPWCPEGFWIQMQDDRRDVGNLVEHSLGFIYVQESASMLPAQVLLPQPGDRVLDMCSAPGSKTTQMAALMQNKGRLIANDTTGQRLKALGINLQRCGVANTITTMMSGENIRNVTFDKILVDAPCSATGTLRRRPISAEMWNPNLVKRLARIQLKLALNAYTLLEPGGTMVYSTCTMEPEENEGVVTNLVEKTGAKILPISLPGLKTSTPVKEFEGQSFHKDTKHCLRIFPQDNDTEGFFVTHLQKL